MPTFSCVGETSTIREEQVERRETQVLIGATQVERRETQVLIGATQVERRETQVNLFE